MGAVDVWNASRGRATRLRPQHSDDEVGLAAEDVVDDVLREFDHLLCSRFVVGGDDASIDGARPDSLDLHLHALQHFLLAGV